MGVVSSNVRDWLRGLTHTRPRPILPPMSLGTDARGDILDTFDDGIRSLESLFIETQVKYRLDAQYPVEILPSRLRKESQHTRAIDQVWPYERWIRDLAEVESTFNRTPGLAGDVWSSRFFGDGLVHWSREEGGELFIFLRWCGRHVGHCVGEGC